MPGLPPAAVVPPYDTLESCLNVSRTRLNDAIASLGGDILQDTQPFMATMVNSAWRQLQAYLSNIGYQRYKRKFFVNALPPINSSDPSAQVLLNWTYYYDAVSYWYPPTVQVLPNDLIAPLKVAERQTGSAQVFSPMLLSPDGLPQGMHRTWNRYFEWRTDALHMPGSTMVMDLEIMYAAYDNDFPVNADGTIVLSNAGVEVTVPIPRCQSALANYLCAEMAAGRDDVDKQTFITNAQTDATLIVNNSDVKLKQRRPVQRKPYANRRNGYAYAQPWGY